MERMWNVCASGLQIFVNSVARWWKAPADFENLVKWTGIANKKGSLKPHKSHVKFYNVIQCLPSQTSLQICKPNQPAGLYSICQTTRASRMLFCFHLMHTKVLTPMLFQQDTCFGSFITFSKRPDLDLVHYRSKWNNDKFKEIQLPNRL